MTDLFSPFLASASGVAILDGGLATELERRGLDLRDALWSAKILVEAPQEIEAVHYDYFLAGADVGTSASYQATFAGFAARGIGANESERLLRRSVELVDRARERFWSEEANRNGRSRPLVAASIGCYGASLHDGSEYRGDYGLSRKELMDFHRIRLRVLVDSGADLLAFETIPSQLEAEAVVALLEELPHAPPAQPAAGTSRGLSREPLAECFASRAHRRPSPPGINRTAPRFVSASRIHPESRTGGRGLS
jgi:homocysteine S-methyltransferase